MLISFPKLMKTNHTDITIVLDRSGSMQVIASDTVGGFNQLLKDQQSSPGTADITLHQFDDVFETPIPTTDIQSAQPLVEGKTFVPRGSTAMNDAIGRAINETGKRLSEKPDDQRAEKVVFVIITDGQENASKEFTGAQVKEMVKHQTTNYQWCFVFLAANQDAILTGRNLGVDAAFAATYAHTGTGAKTAFANTSSNLAGARGVAGSLGPEGPAGKVMAYSQEQREEQEKPK